MGIADMQTMFAARRHVLLALGLTIVTLAGMGEAQEKQQELFPQPGDAPKPQVESPSSPAPGSDARRFGDRLRSQRVALTPDGTLRGRLSVLNPNTGASIPIQSVKVSLLRNGKIVSTARPEANGEFEASGLEPGVHALVAAGEQGFMAFSLELVAAQEDRAAQRTKAARILEIHFQADRAGAQIDGAAVPPTNFNVLRTLVRNYVPIGVDGGSGSQSGSQPPSEPPAAVKAEPVEPVGAEDAATASILRNHTVRLQPGGRLVGRVRRLHPQTGQPLRLRRSSVFLLQDNEVVARTPVDEDLGMFSFEGVEPGAYSVTAVGPGSLAAFSLYVDSEAEAGEARVRRGAASLARLRRNQVPNQLQIELAAVGPENIDAALQIVAQDLPGGAGPGQPAPGPNAGQPPVALPPGLGPGGGFGGGGGGFGGGGFGGGGGGGLGGGGLGLLAVGGAVAGIIAVADNNNQPASPFKP